MGAVYILSTSYYKIISTCKCSICPVPNRILFQDLMNVTQNYILPLPIMMLAKMVVLMFATDHSRIVNMK